MGCGGSKNKDKKPKSAASSGRTGGNKPAAPVIARTLTREDYYSRNPGRHHTGRTTEEPPPLPTQEEARSEEEKGVLKVKEVDFNIADNTRSHKTYFYEVTEDRQAEDGKKLQPQLVVRRGQPFDITIKFDRPFDSVKDDIRLIFDVGEKPKESKGTCVSLMLSDQDLPKQWGAKVIKNEGTSLTIRVMTPPKCIVAKWNFRLDAVVKKESEEKVFRYNHNDQIYILFNAWCPDDLVYMDDETSRFEYVLNDHGKVYRGTKKSITAKPWNFGQFEDFMLDCVFHILDQSKLSYAVRGNPILVCRKISAVANSPDDNGILVGNWSGEYSGGRSPLSWGGSVAILEQYWKTLRPVKYGQCWVFSGIVTTICRCLGIPCRSVTNFASAHDCDGSITIDNYWTPEGEPIEELNEDSIWNFHVWNEAWMARPDLPPGYGGWQAIDSTPQETSDGVYCCGPASLEALKNGLVHLPYDGPFIFAEVNADRVNWIKQPDGSWKPLKQSHAVGKNLSTKSPYNENRMDVTIMYKYPEGSQQERTAVWRAAQEGSTRKDIYTSEIQDMTFDLVEKEKVMVGKPFNVTLKIENQSEEERTVKATLTAAYVYYTGVPGAQIKCENYTINCSPKAADNADDVKGSTGTGAGEVTMTVTAEEYIKNLVDMMQFKISAMVQVVETKQFHCESDVFQLVKPGLQVKAPEEATVDQEVTVEASFTNPMTMKLTACEFEVEGPGLQKPLKIKHGAVAPNGVAKMTATIKPQRPGTKKILVNFDSKELSDLTGEATIKINPKE